MASVSSPLNSSSGMRPWSLLYFPPSESTETQKPKKFCMKVGLALAVNVRGNETMHTAPAIRYISVTMTPSRRGRARQFLHALAAILLVTCSFTSQASTNVSEAHKIASMAIDVNPDEVNGLLRQQNSPQELLHRGIALLHEGGANKEAVRVLEAAVTLWQEESGTGNLQTADAATAAQRLGEALALEGDHERSAAFYALAVGAFESLFGAGSLQAVESLTGLGFALLHQGKGPEAALILEKAMWVRAGHKMNKGSIEGMTQNLGGLVEALSRRGSEDGETDEGQELKGALAGVEKINLLAWRFFVQHWPFEGQTVMLQALGAIESDGGGEAYPPAVRDLLVSTYLYNLGFLRLAVLGEYKSAVEVLSRAQALRSTILGDLHPLTVQVVVSRGHALSLTGNTYLAVNELTSTANGLIESGQAAKAEALARQALRLGYEPLGTHTYAHTCYTQHLNMLKLWGKEGETRANDFQTRQLLIARKAQLTIRDSAMVAASKTLAKALAIQIEEEGAPELLELSEADRDVLREEWTSIKKLVRNKRG